jgi:hypothetical protein
MPLADVLGFAIDGHVTVGDLVVGGGTIALALFTRSLAGETRTLALQTRQDVALTAQSIEASDLPFVIPSPAPLDSGNMPAPLDFTTGFLKAGPPREAIAFGRAGDNQWLTLRLWNLGKGPAIVTAVRLTFGTTRVLEDIPSDLPIAAGQARDDMFAVVHGTVVPADAANLTGELIIHYRHASGTSYTTACGVVVNGVEMRCDRFAREVAV